MSDVVRLVMRGAPPHRLEAECVRPDRFGDLSAKEIAALPVWVGGRAAQLGEFFAVEGGRAPHVRIEGDCALVDELGAGMAGGYLLVDGDAGRGVGRAMAGGAIQVRGGVGDAAGAAPPGASRGMTGGEIVVRGSAGAEAGAGMRRGLIVIAGDAGAFAGRGMIAGTVIVGRRAERGAGRWMKRGTLVALGPIERPATFRYACTYRPPHLRLTFAHLRRRHGLEFEGRYVTGRYRRYSGDLAEVSGGRGGRGEILEWAGE